MSASETRSNWLEITKFLTCLQQTLCHTQNKHEWKHVYMRADIQTSLRQSSVRPSINPSFNTYIHP